MGIEDVERCRFAILSLDVGGWSWLVESIVSIYERNKNTYDRFHCTQSSQVYLRGLVSCIAITQGGSVPTSIERFNPALLVCKASG